MSGPMPFWVREVSSPVTQLTTPPRRASMARSEANPSGSDSWELERATPSWGDRDFRFDHYIANGEASRRCENGVANFTG